MSNKLSDFLANFKESFLGQNLVAASFVSIDGVVFIDYLHFSNGKVLQIFGGAYPENAPRFLLNMDVEDNAN